MSQGKILPDFYDVLPVDFRVFTENPFFTTFFGGRGIPGEGGCN